MTLRRIVVPTDFSEHAAAAARFATRLAARDNALVTLLHVSGLPDYSVTAIEPMYLPPQAWEQLSRREIDHATKKLDVLAAELAVVADGRYAVDTALTRGDAVREILSFAESSEADLVVIASHGASGSLRFLFGSVAAHVSREAKCPVMVTRPGAPGDARPKRALVAVDYSRFSLPSIELAASTVGPGGRVDVVHVWQQPSLLNAEMAATVEQLRATEVERMIELIGNIDIPDITVRSHVEIGSPAHEVLDAAHELNSELIVIGSHGRHGVERIIGTHADRILRHADVPVLLLPEGALPGEHHDNPEDPARYRLQ